MRTPVLMLLLLVTLAGAASAQQVVRRGELETSYQLILEDGQPYLLIHLANLGRRSLEVDFPAGLPLVGKAEPCLPVVLGRPVRGQLSPGQRVRVKVEALSLSLYPHHPGPYELPPAPAYEDESVLIFRTVSRIWDLSGEGRLQGTALKMSRLATYALSGHVPPEEVRAMATEAEWAELQRLLP